MPQARAGGPRGLRPSCANKRAPDTRPNTAAHQVIGHGMNAQELAKNPRLDRFFVR